MANMTGKKVNLSLPSDLLKAAKSQATLEGKRLDDWIADLIRDELTPEKHPPVALLLGRLDSRIDQRTASLEQQLEVLTNKVESLLNDQPNQPMQAQHCSLSKSAVG